jgi:hypothetical protein
MPIPPTPTSDQPAVPSLPAIANERECRSLVQTAQMLVSSRPRENLVAIAIAVTPSSALCASRSAACWSAAGLVSHEQ